MPNEKTKQIAEEIFNDFRGACYYADPEILSGFLRSSSENELQAEGKAVEVLRHLLRRYAIEYATDRDVDELAKFIDPR